MNDYVVLLYEDGGVLALTEAEYKRVSELLEEPDKVFNVEAHTMLIAAFKAGEMNNGPDV